MIIPSHVRQKADKLLAMYATYKNCSEEQQRAARTLAKARLKGESTSDLEKNYQQFTQKLRSISDAMTFASPLVWALYKFEAYADEAQPIRTVQDFRVHCSKLDYICTKRFLFVNQALRERGLAALDNTKAYADNTLLSEAFEIMHMLSQSEPFMKAWEKHEYYKHNGAVAKWENFTK